ncbi:bifunctional hydroxymethylpyrimidine kinase/phosphomethylpyrimidine kinase [Oceanirhabdus sp. W0125-5]|uniref:bifunctional hydroxymethylpyrimidine kinase/phosphomethylpyrimidine kinase n=1 Tax=Oceanirhabdus sp. W0125-5 TaxID=2999116 RepID=UPI0022F2E3C5|nr:bifunctional hydroxymethylpyrimidine kinase/phosphomethylpyrimidine kinase [Oceanirhabdus sp. W0125-5]WBW99012.1 bifunctional hydroxymethylpyrimidine kinase/phosphomethylpyrimidine kinase [Oceanirhabdus sp. W0125-5]
MKKVLTIAGSDCSGGAGIQADLKTITAHKCYGMSVITALTAQNTTGVYGIESCSDEFIKNQMDCVFKDIFPDAVKIGMVASSEIIESISQKLKEYKPKNVVVDPVMVATSGSKLLNDDAIDKLLNELIPLSTVITPNLFEAEILCGFKIKTEDDMVRAARKIGENYEGHILIKGGHLEDNANDLLFSRGEIYWFEGERVHNPNTHGTGCTLSSAIASNLALGYSVEESIRNSKEYITGALKANLDLGKGSGPLDHCYKIN